jgi:hypothetical protein
LRSKHCAADYAKRHNKRHSHAPLAYAPWLETPACVFVCLVASLQVFALFLPSLRVLFVLAFFATRNGGISGSSGAFIQICASLNFIDSAVAGWRRAPISSLLRAVAAHYLFGFGQTLSVNGIDVRRNSASPWSRGSLQNTRNSGIMANL